MDCLAKLDKANLDLSFASSQIQAAFEKAASKTLSTGVEENIEPVKLLHRIALLESSINQLHQECGELTQLRPLLAEQTTSKLLRNFEAIKELSILVKGGQNTNIHHATEELIHRTKEQHHFWNQRIDGKEIDQSSLVSQLLNQQPSISPLTTELKTKPPSLKMKQNSDDGIDIELSEKDFNSIPESIRGRCKLEHVRTVASFIYRDVANKYAEGLRGRFLHLERQHITKYCGEFVGLYSVIMNASLWREIISTLTYLDFLKADKDGFIIMSNFQEQLCDHVNS